MAALDTFAWFAGKFYPQPSAEQQAFLDGEREYLLSIRNENERLRYINSLIKRVRHDQRVPVS